MGHGCDREEKAPCENDRQQSSYSGRFCFRYDHRGRVNRQHAPAASTLVEEIEGDRIQGAHGRSAHARIQPKWRSPPPMPRSGRRILICPGRGVPKSSRNRDRKGRRTVRRKDQLCGP